jgi:glutathione S-transferase
MQDMALEKGNILKLTFIYLNFPFWRAEVSRIALFLSGIEFENRVVLSDEFQRVKADGRLDDGTVIPHHQLPCLIVDGHPIVQTGAIARYCGKLSGLYPKNNDLLAAQIDQVLDLATDITVLVSTTGRMDNDQEKMRKRKVLSDGELGCKLDILEKNIKPNCIWINGRSMGLEDIAIWRLMGWLSSGTLDGIPTTILRSRPKILRVCQNVDAIPKIQEWIQLTYKKDYNRGKYR